MATSIELHIYKKDLPIAYETKPLDKATLLEVVDTLNQFNIKDEEAVFFLSLMKIIQDIPSEEINDALYNDVKKLLETRFLLYRYYGVEAFQQSKIYPPYSNSLTSMVGCNNYLTNWVSTPAKSGIDPAGLFAQKIIDDDKREKPLRYLSYCRDPLCGLFALKATDKQKYEASLTKHIKDYVTDLPKEGPITYIGFASGQLGRDALRLKAVFDELAKQGKKASSIRFFFIDPIYQTVASHLSGKKGDLKTQTQASLIQKSIQDFADFANTLFDIDIKIDLAPDIYQLEKSLERDTNSILFGEDYFEEMADYEARYTLYQLRQRNHTFHAFLAMKDEKDNVVIQTVLNDSDTKSTMTPPNPFSRVL